MIGAKQSWMSETCDKESCEVEAADPPISSSSFATILLRIKHHQLTILLCINIIQPPLSSSQLRGRLKLQHLHLPFYEPTALLDWHCQQQWHFEYHQIISTFLCLCWLFCRIGETPELPPLSSEGKPGTPEKNKVCRCDDVNLQDTLLWLWRRWCQPSWQGRQGWRSKWLSEGRVRRSATIRLRQPDDYDNG